MCRSGDLYNLSLKAKGVSESSWSSEIQTRSVHIIYNVSTNLVIFTETRHVFGLSQCIFYLS